MSKLFKLCAVVISAVFLLSGTALPEIIPDQSWSIDIDTQIAATTGLTVSVINVATGNPDTVVNFKAGDAILTIPWVQCNQYLKVVYSSNYGTWGLRFVTDNIAYLNSLDPGWDVQFTNPAADGYLAGDKFTWNSFNGWPVASGDYWRFAGMRRKDVTKWPNPNQVAVLGWQPMVAPLAIGSHPAVPTVITPLPVPPQLGECYQDVNIGDLYQTPNNAWAYLSDKTVYKDNVGVPDPTTNYCDERIYLGQDGGGNNVYNYSLIAFGSGVGGGYMQVPQVNGDGDIAVYLSSRFGYTDWNDGSAPAHVYILGAGTYSTRLLMELFNE